MSTLRFKAVFYYLDDETDASDIELPVANISYWAPRKPSAVDPAWWNTCVVTTKSCFYVKQTPDQVRAMYEDALRRTPQPSRLHDRFSR